MEAPLILIQLPLILIPPLHSVGEEAPTVHARFSLVRRLRRLLSGRPLHEMTPTDRRQMRRLRIGAVLRRPSGIPVGSDLCTCTCT